MRRTSITLPAALLVMILFAVGCNRTANPSGKISYQGKPVVWGTVTLRAVDGSMHQAGIDTDGTYRLERVPVGTARVGVSSPDPTPSARGKGSNDPRYRPPPALPAGAWFALPDKLGDPSTSGHTLEVGGASADIELK